MVDKAAAIRSGTLPIAMIFSLPKKISMDNQSSLGEKNGQFFPSLRRSSLGGLHKPEVQDEIMQGLADLL